MFNELYGMMNWPIIEGIEYSDIRNPHDLLGPHMTDKGLLIQAYVPGSDEVLIEYSGKKMYMCKMDDAGFYAALIDTNEIIPYKLLIQKGEEFIEKYDAYSFKIGEEIGAIKKFNTGINYSAYDLLGAHKKTIDGVSGVVFRVWAPAAVRVSVVGDFNNWDGRFHQMSEIETTGVFEIFVPEIEEGELYKYEIKIKRDENILKSDPYAVSIENKENGATVITNIDNFKWTDDLWLKNRENFNAQSSPLSVYQLNIGTFARNSEGRANYKEIAKDVADYVSSMGYTHIELMPIAEYFDDLSLGYLVNFFYAPTSRYGSAEELMYFVDYMHSKNIGVILDWSINQFASDNAGLGKFDGSQLYEHANPKRGVNPRNGALLFNLGRPEVKNFLLANAFMWIDKFHMDGLCVANAASMLYLDYDRKPGEWEINILGGKEDLEAIELLKHLNSIIHHTRKGVITIADDNSGFPQTTGEVSDLCVGFDLKTNTEWRKDVLSFLGRPAYSRKNFYNDISLSMIYQYSENYTIGYPEHEFIDGSSSLIGRMTGDDEEMKFSNLKLALAYTFVHPGKKTLFMGQDMAQYPEWNLNNTLDMNLLKEAKHKNINDMVKELNKLYKTQSALYELDNDSDGFEWINNISANECILTFVRKGSKEEDTLLVVCNFDAMEHENYKIGVPFKGKYKEIFNTDSKAFGGTGYTNSRLKQSKTDECDGREESVRVNVAPLSISIYSFSKSDEKLATNTEAKANVEKKTTTKKASAKKEAVTKETSKKETPKKAAPKKKTSKKEAPKKEVVNKTEPEKDVEVKTEVKAESKKEPEVKTEVKAEPKKEAEIKAEPKKEPVENTASKKSPAKKK